MLDIDLVRIDPGRRMRRFYRVLLAPDLFGEIVLLREFGRIGSPGRLMRERFAAEAPARAAAARLVAAKRKRGYRTPGGDAASP